MIMMKVNYNKNTQEDIQMALTYAMYMMVTSYFDRAVCRTPIYENKLYIRYNAQKTKDQYQMEDCCLRYIQKELLAKYPKRFWNRRVEVRLTPNADGRGDTIRVYDRNMELKIIVEYQSYQKKKAKKNQEKKKDTIKISYIIQQGNTPTVKRKRRVA